MLKKNLSQTQIAILSLIAPLLGIISEMTDRFSITGQVIRLSVSTINLSLPGFTSLQYNGFNFINLTFYIAFLIGGILYTGSKYKETRLTRFMFSIIMFQKSLALTTSVLNFVFIQKFQMERARDLILLLLFIVFSVVWIWVSFLILKHIKLQKVLYATEIEPGNPSLVYFDEASKWQRFFHYIIDTILLVLTLSAVVEYLIFLEPVELSVRSIESITGDKPLLWLVTVLLRTIYYLFYESILGASPAKLLTETRVVDNSGANPSFNAVLGRTFSRFVPFAPLSFLGHKGWHDKWSETDVVQEKRTGMRGEWYIVIFPVAAALFPGISSINRWYSKTKAIQQFNITELRKSDAMSSRFDLINTDDIITLSPAGYDSDNIKIFLKPEKVNADSILFTKLVITDYNNITHKELEKLYRDSLSVLGQMTLDKKTLKQAIKTGESQNAVALIVDKEEYCIESVNSFFAPDIVLSQSTVSGMDYFSVGIVNRGWTADIVDIKVIEGNIEMENKLPQRLAAYSKPINSVDLGGPTKDLEQKFIFEITVQDTLNRRQVYQIEANGTDARSAILKKLR